jgi:vacuolar-type H+-ATPase subunit E/Vma4
MAVALPVIALALTAVGTGVAAYGQVQAGNKAEDAAKASQAAENMNAQAAMNAAALDAKQVRRRNLLRLGEQRSVAAKSGVLIDDSTADVIYDTSIQGELEAQSALYSGATAAAYSRSRGSIARLEGKNAKSASRISAAGTVIGGLGSAATNYPRMGNSSAGNRSNYGPS